MFKFSIRVQTTIDQAITQIVAAGKTAGTLVNDDNVRHYIELGACFFLTPWTNWVARGAREYFQKVTG